MLEVLRQRLVKEDAYSGAAGKETARLGGDGAMSEFLENDSIIPGFRE